MTISQEAGSPECTACGSHAVSEIIRIDDIPIYCNVPQPSHAAALQVDKGDIHLGFCEDCGHLYNLAFEPTRVEYAAGYENALDFSPRFTHYAKSHDRALRQDPDRAAVPDGDGAGFQERHLLLWSGSGIR